MSTFTAVTLKNLWTGNREDQACYKIDVSYWLFSPQVVVCRKEYRHLIVIIRVKMTLEPAGWGCNRDCCWKEHKKNTKLSKALYVNTIIRIGSYDECSHEMIVLSNYQRCSCSVILSDFVLKMFSETTLSSFECMAIH